jgi:hypothetical protein
MSRRGLSLLLILLATVVGRQAMATHIRAGEITLVRVNCQSLTYTIYITGYVDLIGGQVLFGGGTIDFGDGSAVIENIRDDPQVEILLDEVDLGGGNGVGVTQFRVEHTFSGVGNYVISYIEPNRNDGILNMDNSVNTPFYIETILRIDPFLGCNSSPQMLIAPIDFGCSGVAFYHNPGAFDADGDSLSFEFVVPRKNVGTPVDNYREVDDLAFGGTQEGTSADPFIKIDAVTGDIVWNSPGLAGEYNIAFVVVEWRKVQGQYFFMGSVVRDMQIIIEDCNNMRPELEIPDDLCVEAGTSIQEIIRATDQDGDDVKIEVFSGVLHFPNNPATFQPDPAVFQPQPAQMLFEWQTDCSHIRQQPYLVTFKVTDQPQEGVALVEFATMNITVVAPAPTGLTTTVNADRTIDLAWDNYACTNADSIQIWRRVDSFSFTPDECDVGMPDGTGYELLTRVLASDTSYKDDNLGRLLAFDANYCYRLVAQFPKPQGGESYVSEESCGIIKADGPAITHATVDATSTTAGLVTVSWRGPFEIDQVLFPPPYQYELWRGVGFNGAVDTKIMSLSADTTFQDSGLNTEENPYHYVVKLFDGSNNEVRSSVSASTVYLEPTPLLAEIELSWTADVPWSNNIQSYPMHLIYRDNVDNADPSKLVLIDSVNVNEDGFFYKDDGSFNNVELSDQTLYCYFVKAFGSYGNPKIATPQENWSQIICAQPNDTIAPCPPILVLDAVDCEVFLADKDCDYNVFFNTLFWQEDEADECKDELRGYNVYFSLTGEENTFELIDFVKDTQYLHSGLNSFAGCYYVTAVDRSGNESEPSEIVCNDNCPQYLLPNVFTPNGDGVNETFRPLDENSGVQNAQCPRFVNSVEITFFNRWGVQVYTYKSGGEKSIYINWDGRDPSGKKLVSGMYYYSAVVNFNLRRQEDREQILNGWVQILY